MDAGDQIVKAKLLNATFQFTPWLRRLPAQAEIERQLATETEVVLDIQAKESIAIFLELSCSLTERQIAAIVAELAGEECSDRRETKLSGLKELIVQIHLTPLKHEAEFQVVFSLDPAKIVAKGHVVSDKACLGVVPKAKETIDPDLLN